MAGISQIQKQGVTYDIYSRSVAPKFSTSDNYKIGDLCYYQGTLYKFIQDHDAGAWNSSDVEATTVGDEIDNLNGALGDIVETKTVKTYTEVTAVNNHVGNRVYYNPTYLRIAETDAGTTRAYSIYEVTAGNKYRIYGYGFDNNNAILAVVGDGNLITSGSSSVGLLQVIETGNTENYAWETVEATIEQSGYLYVNYQTAQNPKVELITEQKEYTIDKNGIYIDNGEYFHFVATKKTKLIRKFTRRGPNNLFQWVGTYMGDVDEAGVTIVTTIDTYASDIIGPLSIWNNTLWPGIYGMWAGGNHGKTINGVVCPTAEQTDFHVFVDGDEVTQDGIYYGNVLIKTKNKIYFPQSLTGATFTGATQALFENRYYYLSDKMDVKVRLDFVEDTRVATYYGMQAITVGYDEISAFNNNFYKSKSVITEALNLPSKENKISLHNTTSGLTLDMELKSIGIGNYQFNAGTGSGVSAGYVYIPIQTGASKTEKVYYMLAINTTADQIKSGMSLFWEGTYNIY